LVYGLSKNMNKIIYVLVVVLLLAISSCSILDKTKAVSETPISPEAKSTGTALSVPHPSQSVTIFASPEHTLNGDEREAYIKLLLKNNNSCDLPCWWGIEPGKTTWASVEKILLHLDAKSQQLKSDGELLRYGVGGLDLKSTSTSEVVFSVRQELVENIIISTFGDSYPEEFQKVWEHYSPDKILLKYGKPSRMKVYVSTYGETNNAGYQYWLYYDKLGFLITYGGGIKKNETFHICPNFNNLESTDNQISEMQIYLKPSNSDIPLEAVVGNKGMELIGPLLKNFEDATGQSVDEYYSGFLSDPKNICFETPSSLW
jgi:hypothetical protein